jgi:hypothetical protein
MRLRHQDPRRRRRRRRETHHRGVDVSGVLLRLAGWPREASEAEGAPDLSSERPVGFDAGSKLPASAEGPREAADKASMLVAATGLSTAGARCVVAGIHDVAVQPLGSTPETQEAKRSVRRRRGILQPNHSFRLGRSVLTSPPDKATGLVAVVLGICDVAVDVVETCPQDVAVLPRGALSGRETERSVRRQGVLGMPVGRRSPGQKAKVLVAPAAETFNVVIAICARGRSCPHAAVWASRVPTRLR